MKTLGDQSFAVEDLHCWPINLVWVMAQTHISRPFCVASLMIEDNFYRRNQPTVPSAFAKEIYCAIQAGYSFSLDLDGEMLLLPPEEKRLMAYCDYNIDDVCSMKTVYAIGQNIYSAKWWVDEVIKQLFDEDCEVDDAFYKFYGYCESDYAKHVILEYFIDKYNLASEDLALRYFDEIERTPEERLACVKATLKNPGSELRVGM